METNNVTLSWIEEIPWLIDEVPTIADMLECFHNELTQAQHDKLRLYVNKHTKQYTLLSFTTGWCYKPDDQDELSKDECTHHAILHKFYQINFDENSFEELAIKLLNNLEWN